MVHLSRHLVAMDDLTTQFIPETDIILGDEQGINDIYITIKIHIRTGASVTGTKRQAYITLDNQHPLWLF
ncbi:MAG: hypothetical protein OQK82_02605 [Candidatus Pacearchaeota archaeon]|nr:hypothetical protein [Candidatus Pacearchaeota archaeon]